jgi:hypothetical protein
MTRDPSPQDDLSPEERLALAAWEAPPPPPGLSARVLDQLDSLEQVPPRARPGAMRRQRPGRAFAWGAVGLALAAGLALALWPRGKVFEQQIDAGSRVTVAIGERGVLVAEKGSELHFRVEPDGATRVEQGRGDVFYRVEPGAAFSVATPLGELTVTGTCLRVAMTQDTSEMTMQNNGKRAGGRSVRELTGAALLGAAATSVLFVTVFEGRVDAATPTEKATIEAGQTGTLRPDGTLVVVESGAPTFKPEAEPTPAVPDVQPPEVAEKVEAPTVKAPEAAPPAPAPTPESDAQRAQREQLESKVASLERELVKTRRLAEKTKTYDLQPETLQKMATRCELRWDHPSLRVDRPVKLDDETVKAASLSESERPVVEEVFRRTNEETLAELRRLYTVVTGDDQVDNLAPEAMLAEINDKSEHRDLRLAFERLSAERAGLQPAPAEGVEQSAVEQVYRLLTSVGDRLETELSAKVGPERARQMRDAHDGWGSASRSSYGCPERTP